MTTNWGDRSPHYRDELASRESPYGVLPEKEQFEPTDPRNIAAIEWQYKPVLARLGIEMIGL